MIEKGFYYHYKHDPNGPVNNFAYEVLGTALNTEDSSLSVVYRPLYETGHIGANDFYNRPYEMFIGMVDTLDPKIKRFEKINDIEIISELNKIKKEIYKGT